MEESKARGKLSFTENYLAQKRPIDDDFMVIRLDQFERMLIFNRSSGDSSKNHEKRLFLRLLHTIVTLLVHGDDDLRGRIGIIS